LFDHFRPFITLPIVKIDEPGIEKVFQNESLKPEISRPRPVQIDKKRAALMNCPPQKFDSG
jgi:hypothetical protein